VGALTLSDGDLQDRNAIALIVSGGGAREKGVEMLFRKYRRPLLSSLGRRGMDSHAAEDIVQEVFIRAVRGASAFRHDAKVSTWLFQIARNLHIDQIRKERPEATADDDAWREIEASVAAPDAGAHGARFEHDLQDCFDRVFAGFARSHPAAAEVLDKIARFGWSTRDVARFLQRTEGATREYLSQVRKKLRVIAEPCRQLAG
jgi:RNA polymerase sigma-70 factor (ECF subfamily)